MKELDYKSMGMRIRQLRKAKEWSQGMLAEKCGISMSFLGHIERGSRIMSMETFVNICDALDAGADELLWGTAVPSDAVLKMWNLPEKGKRKGIDKGAETGWDANTGGKPDAWKDPADVKEPRNDSYAVYIKIMKSVAEILHEPIG